MTRIIHSLTLAAAVVLTIAATAVSAADAPRTLGIGQSAPDFKLPGVDGKTYSLASFDDAKVLVMVFTCNHCPTAQAYEGRIKAIASDYKDKGVTVVAISPNDDKAVRLDELGYTDLSDSFADMKLRAKAHKFNFPYLYDGETQAVAHAYGPVATPHVFIFDRQRKLQFAGRVDNAENPRNVTSHDARNAIDALLAGKPVPVATTKVFGCSIKWASKRASAATSLAQWDKEKAALVKVDEAGLKKLAANDTKKWRLINVWATWCGPCVAEFPKLVEMHRMYRKRNFEIVTVSADFPKDLDKAQQFLQSQHASMTNVLFDSEDRDKLINAIDPKWQGPLPYTILVAPGGEIVYRLQGPIEGLEVKRAIVQRIGRTYF